MRPRGVVSKKDMGALRIEVRSREWRRREAWTVLMAKAKDSPNTVTAAKTEDINLVELSNYVMSKDS